MPYPRMANRDVALGSIFFRAQSRYQLSASAPVTRTRPVLRGAHSCAPLDENSGPSVADTFAAGQPDGPVGILGTAMLLVRRVRYHDTKLAGSTPTIFLFLICIITQIARTGPKSFSSAVRRSFRQFRLEISIAPTSRWLYIYASMI